jgi:hypothetical protein
MQTAAGHAQAGNEIDSLTDKCLTLFPSVTKEGYEPFLPYRLQNAKPDKLIEAVTATLNVCAKKQVYFFRHGARNPEILSLLHLLEKDAEQDLCIMPDDGSWLLHHSKAKSWQWGRQHKHSHLFHNDKKRFFIHWGTSNLRALSGIITPAAQKMQIQFDMEDLRRSESAFRQSKTDSFIYIVHGDDAWFEITMQRHAAYYHWQFVTHHRQLLEPWRNWFNHYH